jgi:SAM-dependent methyltransferase
MPKISVITPTNSVEFYHRAKASMLRQTMPDWEWIVLWNGNSFEASDDSRIIAVPTQVGIAGVGALKREACTYVTSPYCVEFDHDDELSRDCLEKVLKAFEESGANFVYSDNTHVLKNGRFEEYGKAYGWTMRKEIFRGEKDEEVMVHNHPLLIPQNISRIWYAPDHVRAWRMDAYVAVGGHKSDQFICDDQDLMIRFYKLNPNKFFHIPECLYKYNVHGANTWLSKNNEIQKKCIELHDEHIYDLALVHGRANGLGCYDLGGGISCPIGWTSVDVHDSEVNADLNQRWPFEDDSVGVFRAHDFIEHIKDQIHLMNEAYRCLCHGGLFLISVPSTDGRGAFCDPSHVSFWNQQSFAYYTRNEQARYIRHLGLKCKFQVVRLETHFPNEWAKSNHIPYVKAHLAAIKEGPVLHGLIEI